MKFEKVLKCFEMIPFFEKFSGGAVRVSRENPDGPELRKSHTRKRSGTATF